MTMIAVSATRKGVLGAMMPSFTWKSSLIAINAQKYEDGVRLMDVSPETWCVEHFPAASHPCIALAVDTFGNDTNPTSDLPIFFDRAHSLGVKFRQIGMASAISFSPSKIIPGPEGGIMLSNKKNFVEGMITARDAASRMSEEHAINILQGLKLLPEILDWKADTYITYRNAFKDFQFQKGVNTNHQVIGMLLDTHEQREHVLKMCPDIEFKAYYEPIHTQFGVHDPNLTNTDDIYRRILCLPSWYGVDRQYVISRIKEVLER
jgi:dTDP-4-amino-4,6-dideoxygalactose transaminase